MLHKKATFTMQDDDGKEGSYDILFTFENDETGKSYIVYTDYSLDETGGTQVFTSILESDANDQRLLPIESEKEWKVVEIILEELQNEICENDP